MMDGVVTRFMRKRPLALAAGLLALGALMGSVGRVPAALWGALMCAAGLWFLWKRRFVALFAMLMLVGAWGAGALASLEGPMPQAVALVEGRVCETPRVEDARVVMTLDRVALDGQAVDTRLRLYFYGVADVHTGDWVTATAETWRPQGVRNPGGFDFAQYLTRNGVRLCATVKGDAFTVDKGAAFSPLMLLDGTREAIAAQLDRLYPDHAGLARSILIGDKSALPEDMLEQFRTSGVAHLLSVSGLHVSCLAVAIAWLLRRLGVSRRGAFFVTLPVVALYAVLVGLSASAVRAALIYALMGGARLDGRPYDSLTGLAASLMILLTVNPLWIGDAGLILSFSAIAGILLLMPLLRTLMRIQGRKRPVRWLLEALAVSLAAQLGTLPALCCMYGAVTPYATLTNLAAIPLSTLALPLMALSVVGAFVWPPLGVAVAWCGGACLNVLTALTSFVAGLPLSVIYAPSWPWYLCAAFAVLCAACSTYVNIPPVWRVRLLAALALPYALSFVLAYAARPAGLAITFLDAGQADAAVISAQGQLFLTDVGSEGSPSDDYVRVTGQGVAGVFLTHPHSDHAGGLKELMSIRTIPTLYLPGCWHEAQSDLGIQALVDEAVRRGAQVRYLWAGDRVQLSDDIACEVLAPKPGYVPPDGNAASLMLRFVIGDGSALIAGDLPMSSEPEDIPECTLIKASHHGSRNSTSTFMLRAASPLVAAISVGRNGYGHPAPALLERLAAAGAAIYRTDQSGALTAYIRPDGTIEMETFL